MIQRPPRSTLSSSSAASDVYKRQASWWRAHFSCAPGRRRRAPGQGRSSSGLGRRLPASTRYRRNLWHRRSAAAIARCGPLAQLRRLPLGSQPAPIVPPECLPTKSTQRTVATSETTALRTPVAELASITPGSGLTARQPTVQAPEELGNEEGMPARGRWFSSILLV